MYITPGQGQNNTWSQFLFQIVKIQPICHWQIANLLQVLPIRNDILTIFPIQMHGRPKLTLR